MSIYDEVSRVRTIADAQAGDDSIERLKATDTRWLPILVEEVGDVAHELTYDHQQLYDVHTGELLHPKVNAERVREQLRGELIQVAAVALAWIDALDHRPS